MGTQLEAIESNNRRQRIKDAIETLKESITRLAEESPPDDPEVLKLLRSVAELAREMNAP